MKTDDFEKLLQEQPMRQVPGHWRADILKSAASASSPQRLQSENQKSWLHQLLWPCPQAWGALAAVWIVVLFLNASARDTSVQTVQTAKIPTQPREVMMAVKLQLQFRAELMSAIDVPVAEPPKLGAPQSRIEPSVRITIV
jgi:hypothetical protein